ncbi:hypothetical protein [Streptomyces sp. NPDC008121]|uniref:hypothetical protein n=1 Tax=Streptomyces sp. NPDC008121 TaxID=3364809 RepID=UPI0036EAD81A
MARSTTVSRTARRLRTGLAAAVVAAAVLSALPAAQASAATPKIMIRNGAFPDYKLCASPTDDFVWLKPVGLNDPYCSWKQLGSGNEGQFTLYSPAKDEIMYYTGGNEGLAMMGDNGDSPAGPNGELWTWGGRESWGSSALQSYWDSGQNVDAKSPGTQGGPRADQVRTRGWRHGYQRELTWNAVPLN